MSVPLPESVQAFFDATNAEDRKAFLAAFTDDGVVDDWGREFQGHKAIGRWSDSENIGVHSRFEITDAALEFGAYVIRAKVSGGGFNGSSQLKFRIVNDRISRLTITE